MARDGLPPPVPGLAAFALPVATGLGLVTLAAVVARTGWEHLHNRLFAGLYLLSGVKSLADALTSTNGAGRPWADGFHAASPLFPDAATWSAVGVVCGALGLPALLLFASRFPRPAPWVLAHPWRQVWPFLAALLVPLAYLTQPAWLHVGPLGARGVVEVVVALAATTITAATVAILLRTRRQSPSPIERRQAGYVLLGFIPSFAATWAITALVGLYLATRRAGALLLVDGITQYLSPVLELLAAAGVAFAILKYRLLSFEVRVKGGAKYLLMTALVSTALFLAATYVGNFVLQGQLFSFAGPQGSAILAGLAGMLLFKPVERLSARVSDRLFPDAATDRRSYDARRTREIYLAQVTAVLRDGHVTEREWRLLRALRTQLHLSEPAALAIEHEAEKQLGMPQSELAAA